MIKVLLAPVGIMMLFIGSRQMFLMFRDGSFRARGNRLIRRNGHPVIFWMNFGALALISVIGVVFLCWAVVSIFG